MVWADDDYERAQASPPWIGAGPPHGVLPIANVLSIPAVNTFAFRPFAGAPASVVFATPLLRYLTLFECVPVDRRSIAAAVARGVCVGIVPDGVAGIFRMRDSARGEFVCLKTKKGLARLALKTGTPILPAYSFGNTQVRTRPPEPPRP
jgi:2-acylglycerol O-acyltransferase 2